MSDDLIKTLRQVGTYNPMEFHMGTRADFYVGRGEQAEWLGSIAWDGHPDGIDDSIRSCNDEQLYRSCIAVFLSSRDDATVISDGWPWPWNDSRTTDYAYAFDDGRVWSSCFGRAWQQEPSDYDAEVPDEKVAVFPDMTDRKNVTMGKRSGLIICTSTGLVKNRPSVG